MFHFSRGGSPLVTYTRIPIIILNIFLQLVYSDLIGRCHLFPHHRQNTKNDQNECTGCNPDLLSKYSKIIVHTH